MNKKTTYALLMRSEEKGRDFLETAVYMGCIFSTVFAIWQFAREPVTLMSEQPTYSGTQLSHFQFQRAHKS